MKMSNRSLQPFPSAQTSALCIFFINSTPFVAVSSILRHTFMEILYQAYLKQNLVV